MAVTVQLAFGIVPVSVGDPVPPQPEMLARVEPPDAVGTQEKDVPKLTVPEGVQTSVPLPEPAVAVERVQLLRVKVPVTVEFASRLNEQEPVPEQVPPLHPAKVEPVDAD